MFATIDEHGDCDVISVAFCATPLTSAFDPVWETDNTSGPEEVAEHDPDPALR